MKHVEVRSHQDMSEWALFGKVTLCYECGTRWPCQYMREEAERNARDGYCGKGEYT